jgi:hypothetical protein
MNPMLVAMGTKLFQFHSSGSVTAILHRGITRYTIRPFVGVAPTFGAFERNNYTYPFFASHN